MLPGIDFAMASATSRPPLPPSGLAGKWEDANHDLCTYAALSGIAKCPATATRGQSSSPSSQLLRIWMKAIFFHCTGFSSEIGTKLRESAVGQAGGSCYSRAALSSNDSKTLYAPMKTYVESRTPMPRIKGRAVHMVTEAACQCIDMYDVCPCP